jgi:predicted phage tail protein
MPYKDPDMRRQHSHQYYHSKKETMQTQEKTLKKQHKTLVSQQVVIDLMPYLVTWQYKMFRVNNALRPHFDTWRDDAATAADLTLQN